MLDWCKTQYPNMDLGFLFLVNTGLAWAGLLLLQNFRAGLPPALHVPSVSEMFLVLPLLWDMFIKFYNTVQQSY